MRACATLSDGIAVGVFPLVGQRRAETWIPEINHTLYRGPKDPGAWTIAWMELIMSNKSIAMAIVCAGSIAASVHAAGADFHWGNVAIGGGGFVSAVVPSMVEPNLFYARTDVGGAYRWNESEKKWIPLMDWVSIDERGLLGIEAIAVDPVKPGCVYMVAGTVYWNHDSTTNEILVNGKDSVYMMRGRSAFLRSKDYGATWEKIYTWNEKTKWFNAHGNGMGRGNGEALAIDPNNSDIMFYGSKNKGMWKSVDNGTTWKHVDAFTKTAGYDTTWNGSGFSFVQFAPGSSTNLYAGFLREGKNVFKSTDGGATWNAMVVPDSLKRTASGKMVRLMPQRMVATKPDTALYITFADGAGPHTMAWSEGWGMIGDGFGRGAILKYSLNGDAWSDVSPEDFIDDKATGASKYDSLNVVGASTNKSSYEYAAPYGGISINPANPLEMVASSMGYRGPQFWKLDATGKKWKDQWGSNMYHTVDGGKRWIKSFQYYWMEGGVYPTAEQMSANGIGWMFNSSIHWTGSVAMDPFNPKRVFVTSGNGIYMTDDITDYTFVPATCGWCEDVTTQRQVWKVASHGVEEVVPMEVVSVPGGPLISTIGDYDGFRHDDVTKYPAQRHQTNVNGTFMSIGTTRGLAWAPKAGVLVKSADAKSANPTNYTDVPISPVQISKDTGRTWSAGTYESYDSTYAQALSLAVSTDGAIVLWTPATKSGNSADCPAFRYDGNAWTKVSGIDGAWVLGDQTDADVFYAYKASTGDFFRSTDKGLTFAKVSAPGASWFKKMRATPGAKGDLWIPVAGEGTAGKLLRSKDGGETWAAVAGVGRCEAIGFGKAATGATFPAIYVQAAIGGVTGIFQSIDEGATWKRVNDDAHEYGGLANGEFVVGDMNTFGVVYMSTAGNGIAARLAGAGAGATGISDRTGRLLSRAVLGARALQIQVLGEPVDVRVLGLDGRVRHSARYGVSTAVPLSTLMPSRGMYVLEVRSGSRTILNRTVSQLR